MKLEDRCCECFNLNYRNDDEDKCECKCHECSLCKLTYRHMVSNAASFDLWRIEDLMQTFTMTPDGFPVYANNDKSVVIITGYDSNSFDGTFFRFISNDPANPYQKVDTIIERYPWVLNALNKGVCDDCIKKLLNDKIIEVYYEG